MKLTIPIVAAIAVVCCGGGCSCDDIGKSAAGASNGEMKATFDKLPIEERAKMLLDHPGPMDDKIKKIKEMYKQEGKTPPEDITKLGSGGGAPGAPTHG